MRNDLSGGYSKAVLKGNHFAYVSDGDRVITILDLLRGTTQHLNGDSNETILQVLLTRTIVRFVTFNGHMYSASLSEVDGSCRKTTQPSSALQSIASDEDDVAMLYRQPDYVGYRIILTRGTLTIGTFDVSEMGFASKTMLISAGKQCIDFFGYEPIKDKRPVVMSYQHCRYSYAGEMTSQSFLEDLLGPCESVRSKSASRSCISAPVPAGASAVYQIAVQTPHLSMKSNPCHYWTLMFDSDEARLFKQYAGIGASSSEEMPTSRYVRLWKDRYYESGVNGEIKSTSVSKVCDLTGTAKAATRSRDTATFIATTDGVPERYIAVNESFTLCFDNQRAACHIECWDEDVLDEDVIADEGKNEGGKSSESSERWWWTKCHHT
ncbi:hypothetical protein LTR95_008426 [Oleoguttula sp. CCFEE 5521]